MSVFVVDASIAIKWIVEEPGTAAALRLRRHRLLAPDLLIAECTNVLWKKVRRRELSEDIARVSAGILARSDIEFEPMADLAEQAMGFSILLEHAAYDCFYLALADACGCDFVTADAALRQKVQAARLPVKLVLLEDLDP